MAEKNKAYLIKECKRILNETPINGRVENQSDIEFLMDLFRNHAEWELKCNGQKIKSIVVRYTENGTKCFWLIREDDTMTKISYTSCINPVSKKANVKRACRTAEEPRILEYKRSLTFPIVYTLNKKNTVLTSLEQVDIDHYDPDFDVLVDEWVGLNGGYDKLFNFVNKVDDKDTITRFTDPKLSENFAEYSRTHGKIRAISKCDNRSTRRKKTKGNSTQ